jgi:hypothetical protein
LRALGFVVSQVPNRDKGTRRLRELIWNSGSVVSHPSAIKLRKDGAPRFIRRERVGHPRLLLRRRRRRRRLAVMTVTVLWRRRRRRWRRRRWANQRRRWASRRRWTILRNWRCRGHHADTQDQTCDDQNSFFHILMNTIHSLRPMFKRVHPHSFRESGERPGECRATSRIRNCGRRWANAGPLAGGPGAGRSETSQ